MTTGSRTTVVRNSVRRRRAMIVVLWVLSMTVSGYMIAPASVLSLIMGRLSIGPAAASWVLSIPFGVIMLVSTPIGIVLDKTDNRKAIMVSAIALFIAGVWGTWAAFSSSYLQLVLSRAFAGLTFVAIWTGGANIIGDAFPTESRATAMAVFSASGPAGFAVGQFGSPPIASWIGWEAIPALFGVASILLGGCYWLLGSPTKASSGGQTPTLADFRTVLSSRNVWSVAVIAFMAYSLYAVLNSWMPTYLVETLGMSLSVSGAMVAAFPAIGVVARSTGGAISDQLFTSRRRPLTILSFILTLPSLVGLAFTRNPLLALVFLVGAGLFIQVGMGLYLVFIRELVETKFAGTAIAFLTSFTALAAFSAPIIAGTLIEWSGTFGVVFSFSLAVGIAGLALSIYAPEPNP